MSSSDDIWILGIRMTKFGKHHDKDVVDLASEAVFGALGDAGEGVSMKDMGILAAGNLMNAGASFGQQLQKQIGQTGIPVYNVANACATGATALRTAIMAVKSGEVDMGMAVGVEKLAGAGLLGGGGKSKNDGQEWSPAGRYGAVAPTDGRIGTDTMPGVFAQIGMEYGHKYGGTSFELFAKISEKNHAHSVLNPLAAYQKRFTLEEIMGDMMIAYPNTRPMCSANCDGAAAAIVVSGAKLKTLSLDQQKRAIKVSASILTSDPYEEACQILPNVNTLTKNAAKQAYEQAGVGPADLNLVELHDCFATAELVHYDNLGLCEEGGAADFFSSGATWRDGTTPVNVSGGLQSKGHPISATGIANIWEVCHHLRGEAGDRQIEGAKVGMAHVIGLGSACGVHILEKSRPEATSDLRHRQRGATAPSVTQTPGSGSSSNRLDSGHGGSDHRAVLHRDSDTLTAGLDDIRASPLDGGRLDFLVRRPAVGEREILTTGELSLDDGLVGDTWNVRPSRRTDHGGPHPDMQLNVVNARFSSLISSDDDHRSLAGDQLHVDLDLSEANLPAGTRLAVGTAVIEVTEQPHTGCVKFSARFGAEARRLVNSSAGQELRLRGINAKVVQAGTIDVGDTISKV